MHFQESVEEHTAWSSVILISERQMYINNNVTKRNLAVSYHGAAGRAVFSTVCTLYPEPTLYRAGEANEVSSSSILRHEKYRLLN